VNLEPFIVRPSSVGGLYPVPEEFSGLRSPLLILAFFLFDDGGVVA